MPSADKRVSIRNTKTGAVAHGISEHIPDGWERIDSPKQPESIRPENKVDHKGTDTGKDDGKKVVALRKRVPPVRHSEGPDDRGAA